MIKSGIYSIMCLQNNMFYIGSSINIEKRWKEHTNDLKKNRHSNTILQNIYNKYGLESLKFEVKEYLDIDANSIRKIEQKYILKLNPGINIVKRVDGVSVGNHRKILQYSLDGNFLKEHLSVRAASRSLQLSDDIVLPKIDKPYLNCGGFVWMSYVENYPLKIEIPKLDLSQKEHRRRFWETGEYVIYQYSKNGNLLKEWTNKQELIETLNLDNKSLIAHIHSGIPATHKGFIFKMSQELPRIKLKKSIIGRNGTETLEFPSISSAAKYLSVNPSIISRSISTNGKTKGFSFSLKN